MVIFCHLAKVVDAVGRHRLAKRDHRQQQCMRVFPVLERATRRHPESAGSEGVGKSSVALIEISLVLAIWGSLRQASKIAEANYIFFLWLWVWCQYSFKVCTQTEMPPHKRSKIQFSPYTQPHNYEENNPSYYAHNYIASSVPGKHSQQSSLLQRSLYSHFGAQRDQQLKPCIALLHLSTFRLVQPQPCSKSFGVHFAAIVNPPQSGE